MIAPWLKNNVDNDSDDSVQASMVTTVPVPEAAMCCLLVPPPPTMPPPPCPVAGAPSIIVAVAETIDATIANFTAAAEFLWSQGTG